MILAYTILTMMNENFYEDLRSNTLNRCNTSFYFFAGLIDLQMACMMWFIMDEDSKATVVINENTNTVY